MNLHKALLTVFKKLETKSSCIIRENLKREIQPFFTLGKYLFKDPQNAFDYHLIIVFAIKSGNRILLRRKIKIKPNLEVGGVGGT